MFKVLEHVFRTLFFCVQSCVCFDVQRKFNSESLYLFEVLVASAPCHFSAGPRSTRVDFSMGTMNRCIEFRPHLTRRVGFADTALQLRVTTFDHSTSTTTNRPPDQHFHPIFVVRIDGKWVCGWYSATAGRPAHSPGE